jgi:hypothetical protein
LKICATLLLNVAASVSPRLFSVRALPCCGSAGRVTDGTPLQTIFDEVNGVPSALGGPN